MMKIQLRSIGLVSRKFHASALQLAKVGEKISSIQVFEGAPSNNVDISSVLAKVRREVECTRNFLATVFPRLSN